MRRISLSFTLLLGLLFTHAGAADSPVAGLWKTQPGDTGGYLHVQIAPCEDKMCGTIMAAFDKNDAPQLNYAHIGKPIIWDMQTKGETAWSKGKIWAPDRDKTYNSKMSLDGDMLSVSGCVMFFCRSQQWQRIN